MKLVERVINGLIAIGVAGCLAWATFGFGSWYMGQVPALGVDFYNSVTNTALQNNHWSWWFSGYKDATFSGYPLDSDFPQFHYYGMVPFTKMWGLTRGVQVYTAVMLGVLVYACFVLFWQLSKNWGIALALALGVMLSVNIYGSATWGGSLPYFATQCVLPLAMFCVIRYFEQGGLRWLALGILVCGWGFLSHPLPVTTFVVPIVAWLLVVYPHANRGWKVGNRIKTLAVFGLGVYLVGFGWTYTLVKDQILQRISPERKQIAKTQETVQKADRGEMGETETTRLMAKFYNEKTQLIWKQTDQTMWLWGLGWVGAVVVMVWQRKWSVVLTLVAWVGVVGYVIGHIVANLNGWAFLPQGLYRAFWAVPIVIGAVAAAGWSWLGKKLWLSLVVGVVVAVMGVGYYQRTVASTLHQVYVEAEPSSAFPEVLSLKLDEVDSGKLKKALLPSYMNGTDRNKRLYTSNATINIWWNAVFETPLVRGYVDPPIGTDRRSSIFLTDTTLGADIAVNKLGIDEQIAKRMAGYFMDWYAIGYFEGGEISPAGNAPPSTYLTGGDQPLLGSREEVVVPGSIMRYKTVGGKPEVDLNWPQTMIYYKTRDDAISPIMYASTAPSVLVVGRDRTYEYVWRSLAGLGWDSRSVVSVMGDEQVDRLSTDDINKFSAVVLYNYTYHDRSKAWKVLEGYVKQGGKVWIETGMEGVDAEAGDLPEWWPVRRLTRKGLGTTWDVVSPNNWSENIDVGKIGQPIFNGEAWSFSYAEPNDISSGATVLLTNHGKVIMAERQVGLGKVVWSGMNLPYYINQNLTEDGLELFGRVVTSLVDIKLQTSWASQMQWTRPEKVTATGISGASGVVYKVQAYPGWSSSVGRVWKAGPSFPGFIYVPLGQKKVDRVDFRFGGKSESWLTAGVTIGVSLILLEIIVLGSSKTGNKLQALTKHKLGRWWEKEEEV